GDELLEVVEPDGHHDHVGPVDGFVDAYYFRVTADVGRHLAGLVLVAAGQEEVLTAGGEIRRERATDGGGADDGNRGVGESHLGQPFVTWFRVESIGPIRCTDRVLLAVKLAVGKVIGCPSVLVIQVRPGTAGPLARSARSRFRRLGSRDQGEVSNARRAAAIAARAS